MTGLYEVELSPCAARQLRKMDRPVAKLITKALRGLATCPRPDGVKAVKSLPGALRVKVGKDYRVVYEVADDRLIVLVLAIAHRKDVYRAL